MKQLTHIGLRSASVFAVLLLLTAGEIRGQSDARVPTLSRSDFSGDQILNALHFNWRFRAGDQLEWAAPGLDDSEWEEVSSRLGPAEFPFLDWEGIGWFRIPVKVDSSLVNYPLGLIAAQHNGASEIYLDGRLLFRLGEVSVFADEYTPYQDTRPRTILIPDTSTHILAVRYANHDAQRYIDEGYEAGFRLLLGDLDHFQAQAQAHSRAPWVHLFFGGILLAFTLIHFLLYVFYPGEKKNLYFALFTGFLALITYTRFETLQSVSPLAIITYDRLYLIAWMLSVIYALRFSYSLFYHKVPKQFWFFLVAALALGTGTWYNTGDLEFYRELFILLVLAEIIRVLTISFYRSRDGVWIIGTGMTCFTGGIFYAVLAEQELVSGDPMLGSIYGSILLICAMSVYLSRDFAKTQRRLEYKLMEVKHLSNRSLEQERINKEKELERKLLAAENERKTLELEEARTLQLSMLPKNIPATQYWDIAVFMETAQEVGGDYYDFYVGTNGDLRVVMGDATGHGMKAGIIVATAKSYFHTLAGDHGNLSMLQRISSGIRNMDLKLMFMGMMLLKCDRHTLELSTAGMPPVLIWRKEADRVEEVVLKGLPLGTRVDYPYESIQLDVKPGDTLLLMSDGLMELFNEQREQLGLERVSRAFREVADTSPSNILTRMNQLIEQWSGSHSHEDDITLMVMKAKYDPQL